MAIYTEKIIDKTGKKVDKLIDGKKVYYIRTYITDELGNVKQITRHNKNWLGKDGKDEAQCEEIRLRNMSNIEHIIKKRVTIHELKIKYINYLRNKIDNDSLNTIITRLNHFCELDETGQIKIYPNKYINTYTKDIYKKWQNQMKIKKYKKGKKELFYSIKHLNRIHNEICRMIDFAIVEGDCKINFAKQCGKIGSSKEIKLSNINKSYEIINYNEYLKLIDVSKNDLKYNTYFHLAFTSGPRTGEIRAFRCMDYDPIKKQLMVNHTMSKKNELKEPKTASSKAPINLDDETNNKVQKLINSLKKCDNYNESWYIFGDANPISSHALDNAKEKYFKLAGITKHLRLHDFRHSCATWLNSIGISIGVISKILRHANIKETMKTYTHLFEEDYQFELSKINETLKSKTN